MKTTIFLLSILTTFSFHAYGDKSAATGIVKKIRVFSENPDSYIPSQEGRAYIYIDEMPGACGSEERRVVVGTNHPLFETVVSLALVSKTTQSPVQVYYLDSCNMRSNAWDFSLIELQ